MNQKSSHKVHNMKKSKMTTKGGISFGLTIGSAGVATVLNVIFGMAVAFFLIYFFAGFVFSLVVMIVNANKATNGDATSNL